MLTKGNEATNHGAMADEDRAILQLCEAAWTASSPSSPLMLLLMSWASHSPTYGHAKGIIGRQKDLVCGLDLINIKV